MSSVSAYAQVRINNKTELPGGTLNGAYSVQLFAGGGTAPYQFSLIGGYFPTGVNLSPTGLISGQVTTPGTYFVSVRVADARGESVVKDFRLPVNGLPVTVVADSRVDAPAGIPLRRTISANGGALGGPYRISFLSGTLPPGLNFVKQPGNVTQAVISGTPLKEGTYSAVFEARDVTGRSGTGTMVFNIQPNPVQVSPFTLPAGNTGEEYEFNLPIARGFSAVRCVSSSALPAGITLTAGCRLRGLVTTAASLDLRATVADGAGNSVVVTGATQFRLPEKLTITTAMVLPSGALGQPYSKQLLLMGGLAGRTAASDVPRWTIIAGSMPPGLRLDINRGVINGSPTNYGGYRFTVEYAGPEGKAVKTFDLTVGDQLYTWDSPSNLGEIAAGQVATLPTGNFRGGAASGLHHLVSGAYPPGMAPQPDGTLFGTPNAAGTYIFTLDSKAVDGQVASKEFRVVVSPVSSPNILTKTPSLPDAIAGIPYLFADYAPNCSCAANAGSHPYRWQEELSNTSSLPPGLTLRADGELSGTPLLPGTYSFPLILSDGAGRTVSQRYTLRVLPFSGTLSLLPAALPSAIAGLPYSAPLSASGGTAPFSYSSPSGLPSFVNLSATGVLSANAPPLGAYPITVSLRDSQSEELGGPLTVTRTLDLAVTAPPSITRLDPPSVQARRPALQLGVIGSGFTRDSIAFANGTRRLATISLESASLMIIEVPADLMLQPGVVRITIVTNGVPSNSVDLIVGSAAPQISGLLPSSAVAGGQAFSLTVNGSDFVNGAAVRWNGTPLSTSFNSSSRLTASVPAALIASPGAAQITVVNPDNVSSGAAAFSITAPVVPQLLSLNPPQVQAGAAAFNLTANGVNFLPGAVVRWNGSDLPATFVSAAQVIAAVPAGLVAAAGSASVTIVNPGGAASSPLAFNITAPAPQISQLTPATVVAGTGAFVLTVNGAAFQSGAQVRWNGAPLSTNFGSASLLTANVPAALTTAAGSAAVTVANPDGQISAPAGFTVAAPQSPQLLSLTPAQVQAGSAAFSLLATGTNFAAGAVVRWNGADLLTTPVSANQLSAAVPAALVANAGSAAVTVFNPDGQLSNAVSFTITAQPAPSISLLTPSSVQAGAGAFTLTVNGANFQPGSVVRWNGTPLPTIAAAGALNASVDAALVAAAGSATITVLNPDGQSSPGSLFSITAAPAPQISLLNPQQVQAGSPAFTLNVTGSNFVSGGAVRFGNTALPTQFVSATQLTAVVNASLLNSAGNVNVTVANPDGQTSGASVFQITAIPPPQITQLNPTSAQAGGVAFILTVNGAAFQKGAAVRWNGSPLITVFVSATQLTANVPASLITGAGAASITVANPDTQVSAPSSFTIALAAAPQLTNIGPSSAVAGSGEFQLTATGGNFQNGAVVRWNGAALATVFVSATQLTAIVPAALVAATGSGSVTVANPDNQTSPAVTFTITAPSPTLSALSPNSVQAGAVAFTLTVTGANFQSGAAVRWNGTPLITTFVSATQLTANVPSAQVTAAGSAAITVANPDGQTSPSLPFTISAAPAPQITTLAPTSVTAGAAGFTLTVNGSNFVNGAVVRWNGSPLSTSIVSASQLTASVAAGLVAQAGSASITVANPDAQSSNSASFSIAAPAPQISSLNPAGATAGGAAFVLTVTGAGFQNGASVRWNNAPLATTFVSATSVTAQVTASLIAAAGGASVTVANPDGLTSAATTFTVNPAPAPQITSLNPTTALTGSGAFTLTVNGANFVNGAVVRWNGADLQTTFVSVAQVTASVPAGLLANAASVPVTVANPDGQSSVSSTFTITAPAPQITSLNPASAQVGGVAFVITVNGSGFQNGAAVRWNGSPLATSFVSATQLTASVAASLLTAAGSANISVANPDAQTSNNTAFTINPAPAPQITSLAPTSAQAAGPEFILTINGSNFESGASARWNNVALVTTFISATQLTANVPAGLIANAGSASITVTNPDNQASTATTFAINQPAAPQITALSPASAQSGGTAFVLTVTGANFLNGAAVRWNGTDLATTFVSSTQLTATVPAALIAASGSASIAVANPTGQISSPISFSISAPAPQLSTVSPASAIAGSASIVLTASGSNFLSGAVVRWNGAPLSTTFVSSTQLNATVTSQLLAAAGAATITIANPDAQASNAVTFTITAPAPQITGLSPQTAQAGSPALQITITGSGFVSGAAVRWNNSPLAATFVSATQFTANVPASLLNVPGPANVTVQNPDGQTSQPFAFAITLADVAQIGALSPASAQAGGPAFALTVNGSAFQSGAVIKWNGADLVTTFVSSSQLRAQIAADLIANPGTAAVLVSNPDGQISTTATFTITAPPPQITTLNPPSTQAGGVAFTLTVNGSGFQNNSTVRWNGSPLATTFVSATQLTANIAANLIANAGSASVTVANADQQTSTAVTFTISAPTPQITSLSPNSAQAGGAAFTLTVTGANFTANSTVRWNGSALTTTFVSATQLTAPITTALIANPGSASITVANSDAQVSQPRSFAISLAPSPQILSTAPTSAQAGGAAFSLTVNGANFVTGAIVRWNGADLPTTFVSATQITANVAASLIAAAGTANLTVANADGQTSATASFAIQPGPPKITSLSPASAQAAGPAFTVTVTGSGFQNGAIVRWGNTALSTTFVSATQLTASVPAAQIASAGSINVTVANPDSQVSSAVTFAVGLGPSPAISSLAPNTLVAGSAAFVLTVNGNNFLGGANVKWNGTEIPTTFVSSTQLTATVTASLVANAGAVNVTVNNPDGQASPASTFTITARAPQLTSLTPNSAQAGAVALTVTVAGANFQSGATVKWNDTTLPTTFVSATQLTASVAAALMTTAASVNVMVLNSDGQASSGLPFTISAAPAPQLTSLNPQSAFAGTGAFTLTIQGSNFVTGAKATWSGTPLATSFLSATQLTASVPASLIASAGPASVRVTNPDNQNSAALNFAIDLAPRPEITALSPTSATARSAAFTLTVAGRNFQNGATVRWNNAALVTTFVSATQVTADVPAGLLANAGPASVLVANPDGQSSAPSAFTVNARAPQISGLTPASAQATGQAFTLTVRGSDFASGAQIRWNGAPLSTTAGANGDLTATIAASLIATAGNAAVTVANPDGQTSPPSSFSISAAPAPSISSLSPNTTPAAGPSFDLTVQGANFQNGALVRWNGTALETTFVSATQLNTRVTANLIATAGTASVTAANPDGQNAPAATFTISPAPLPQISSIEPTSAVAGSAAFTLIVNGSRIQSGAVVRWNGTPLPTVLVSPTQLSATVNASLIATAGSASVTIVNPDSQSSAPSAFTIIAPKPQITLLTPGSAQAGGAAFTLAVAGSNFLSGTTVRWNDTPLATTFGSAAQLTAVVPADLLISAGTASITAVLPDGQSSGPVNFSIGAAPAPLLNSLTPSTAQAGSAQFTLTVQGANFHTQAAVRWNGTALNIQQNSSTQITAVVPASLIAAAGTGSVVVANPDGQSSTPATFTITAPPPQISSLAPSSVQAQSAAFTLVVNGSAFQSGAAVQWRGVPLPTTFVSATQLSASVTANLVQNAGSAAVTVRNADGQTSSESAFTIGALPKPSISSIVPGSILAGAATTVITVNGANFQSGAVVTWGSTQLATTFGSASQVSAVVPAGLLVTPATVALTVRNADSQISDGFSYNITAPNPVILSLTPNSAPAGSGDVTMAVAGQNFRQGAEVRWNGNPLGTSFVSATQLTATIPAALMTLPGNALVTVRNTDNSISAASTFQVLNALPQVSLLAPSAASAGSSDFTLTLTGANLTRDTVVLWNQAPLPTAFVSATQVTAQVAAGLIARAGSANVGVRNSETQISNTLRFVISESNTPEITRLNPSGVPVNAPAFALTVTGSGFQSDSQVLWGAVALPTTYVSATELSGAVAASLLSAKSSVPVIVRNGNGRTSQPIVFEIGEALQITTSRALPDAKVDEAYQHELKANGGTPPYRWSLPTGSTTPAGLQLTADGIVRGTPTTPGEAFFDVELRDASSTSVRDRLRLLIAPRLLEISSVSPLPQGTAGEPYNFVFALNDPTVTSANWTLLDGALPAGMSLDPQTGALTGTPLEPAESDAEPRLFRFRIEASADVRQARKSFEWTVQPERVTFRITSGALPGGRVGRAYNARIGAVGGRPPFTFTLTSGALPQGITLAPDGGLDGTPSQAGSFSFTVQAQDSQQRTASGTFSIAITDIPGPEITTGPTLPAATPGLAYTATLQASGGRLPYRWTLISGALPNGVAFDSVQARVAGTPDRAGLFRFTVRVTDADNRTDTRTLDLPVIQLGDDPLRFMNTSLPEAVLGRTYRADLTAAGGAAPYRFLLRTGTLPPGLSLDASSINGTPSEPGTYAFSIRVIDANGNFFDRDFLMTISIAPLPAVSIGGITDSINPGQQSLVSVDLSATYPTEVTGRLEMEFTPEPEVQSIDPALQFSTGGRSVEFRVPAGQTRAVFPQTPFGLQTGTVAGVIRLKLTLRVAGRDAVASNEPERLVRIAQTAPVISNASIERVPGGFNLIVVGFSSTREVAEGIAVLNPAPGRLLETTRLTIPLTTAFRSWYDAPASLPFGTQFRLVLPFTGDPASVESMNFTLRNARGVSNEVRVPF